MVSPGQEKLDRADDRLWSWLRGQAECRGSARGFVDLSTGQQSDWRQWTGLVEATKAILERQGIGPGRCLIHVGTNHPSTWTLALAARRLGADFWPMNYRWASKEIARATNALDPSSLWIVESPFRALVEAATTSHLILDRHALWEAAHDALQDEPKPPYSNLNLSPIGRVIMATGGTSFRDPEVGPRLVALEDRHLQANGSMFAQMTGLNEQDTVLVCAPNFHVAGFSTLTLAAIRVGASVVFAPRFSPMEILDAIATWRVTATVMVPTMWRMLMGAARASGRRLEGLRFGICGGAPMDPGLVEEARELGFELLQGYGMTEAGPMVTLMLPGAVDAAHPHRAASAGVPAPGIEVRIVAPDGEAVSQGQSGQIVIRGPNLVEGYLHDLEGSAFKDEFFYSGDRGHLDAEGFLYVEGRLDEMIISGGENIAPSEVEAAFRRAPSIADIAVLGLPDPHWGEQVVALVVPACGQADFDWGQLCESISCELGRYKMPRQFRLTKSLPMTPAGKLVRYGLLDLWYEVERSGPTSSKGSS
jgi:fatty-acyl-CoA synthase